MTTQTAIKKNDVIEYFTAFILACDSEAESFKVKIESAQSEDEKKALKEQQSKFNTKARYARRLIANEVITDAVATQVVRLKLSKDQLKEMMQDSYAIAKFVPMMICLVQKRKMQSDDEHVLSEFLALVAAGANDLTFTQFGNKMRNQKGNAYAYRQPQMCCKMLARLSAVEYRKDGATVVARFLHDSVLGKMLMKAYE